MSVLKLLVVPALLCVPLSSFANSFCNPLPKGAAQDFSKIKFSKVLEIEPLSPGFAVLEGPVWLGDALWMSHIGIPTDSKPNPADVLEFRNGKVITVKKGYGANGLSFGPGSKLVAARHLDGTITRVDDGKIFAEKYQGKRFNSPNDLIFSSSGHLYFSDPDWQNPQPPQADELMYHVSPKGDITGFGAVIDKPNGMMLTTNEKILYVGGVNGLFKFSLTENGKVIDKPLKIAKEKIPDGVDGMSRDCAGNIYVTGGGYLHVLGAGSDVVVASYPIEGATNVAFGGKDKKSIFVTTLGKKPQLWQAESAIPGLPF